MTTAVEWSPNEGILRKFERLAFALVRTRPLPRSGQHERLVRNPWREKCRGLGGPFALAIFIGIPYITEISTGSGLIAALLLAALDACFAVWCYTDLEAQHGHCTGDLFLCAFSSVGEFPAFLIAWWRIQGFSAAFAVCCRSLSEIIDAVTGSHFEIFVEDHFGTFLPLGAKMDVLALLVATVPTLLCSLGMEESGFLRSCLFILSAVTTLTFLSCSLAVANESPSFSLFQTPAPALVECLPDDSPAKPSSAEILTGAAIASVGFFGLYKTSCPDGSSVQYNNQHGGQRHYTLTKRVSLIGGLLTTITFMFYFLEATVLGKARHTSRICQDPPLLWSLEGGWRFGVASLGISALSLATFEFLIPLCSCVTKMANNGLLYGVLKKDRHDFEESKWTLITPLVFGALSALQAFLVDIKVLIASVSSSLMSTHVVIAAAMLASRYQVHIKPSPHQKVTQSRQRARIPPATATEARSTPARRLLTVSFLKTGLSRIPNEIKKLELDGARTSSRSDSSGDRSYLMNDVAIASLEPRDSVSSTVSGYESETDSEGSTNSDLETEAAVGETDIDTAVAEYQLRLRVAALNGGAPLTPTPASARRVSFATVFLTVSCLTIAAVITRVPKMDLVSVMLLGSSGLLLFLLLVVISRQPQRKATRPVTSATSVPNSNQNQNSTTTSFTSALENFFQYSLIPCGPAVAILLHACILVETLDFSGFLFAVWLGTGLIIYFSYGVSKSVAVPEVISVISPVSIVNERLRLTTTASSTREHRAGRDSVPLSASTDSVSFDQCGAVMISTR